MCRGTHTEIRGQLVGIGFLLLRETCRLSSGFVGRSLSGDRLLQRKPGMAFSPWNLSDKGRRRERTPHSYLRHPHNPAVGLAMRFMWQSVWVAFLKSTAHTGRSGALLTVLGKRRKEDQKCRVIFSKESPKTPAQ